MELILSIILGFIVAGLGFCIGVAAASKSEMKLVEEVKAQENNLKYAPMVIECELGQPLTVEQMAIDVVSPNLVKIWQHFDKGLETMPSVSKYAEEMLKWYNSESEYTKLVIVGYMLGGIVRIAWTWQKDTKWVVDADAVEGLEKYYEDALGNPMILGNQEG
jgi:hypothetical protein